MPLSDLFYLPRAVCHPLRPLPAPPSSALQAFDRANQLEAARLTAMHSALNAACMSYNAALLPMTHDVALLAEKLQQLPPPERQLAELQKCVRVCMRALPACVWVCTMHAYFILLPSI